MITAAEMDVCGHRWAADCGHADHAHHCQLDPDHLTDPGPLRPHRCGCGATTTKET